jgi:hypothetical protein
VIKNVLNRFKGTEYEKSIKYTYKKQYRLPKILHLLHIDKNAYYKRKDEAIEYTAYKATERGLVRH